MGQRFLFFISVICISCLCTGYAYSSTHPLGRLDSLQHIPEVTVVANNYKEVIPSQKISGKALEALNSFSVADAIRYFSGVQIKDYGGVGGLKTVDIRSMGTKHMGVFYDGIQLGNAQNGQIDLGKFSLDNIEEISLYNGQKSEIFQSAKDFGSAGTIYLRTHRPHFQEGEKTHIKVFFRTGSFDLVNPSVLWEQKINKNISSSFNAEYIYSSGKYKFRIKKYHPNGQIAHDTTAVRQNGDIKALRLEGGFNGYINQGKWNAKAYYYDSERGIPGAIINKEEWRNPQRQWDRNFFTQGSIQKEITGKYEMLFNAKYANDYMRYLNYDTLSYQGNFNDSLVLGSMYVNNNFTQQEIYVSLANKYRILPTWDAALSADYQWNILDANLRDFVHPKRNTILLALATAFEWERLKGQASLLGTFIFENVTRTQDKTSAQTGTPSDKQEYTPAIFISFQPFKKHNFNLRAFYKKIFRMPTFNDLYYTDIGNIALKPEYTIQYNIGFQYNKSFEHSFFKEINFRTDAYYNEVRNKIIAVPKGDSQYRWMMMNIGYVEIRGIDVSGQVNCRVARNFTLQTSLNYTYQKAQDFSDKSLPYEYGGQIAYIPWHSGSLIVRSIYKTWDMNYSFIYVGERYHNSANIRENYEQPWYTHDITLGKEFNIKKMKFKLSAEINNLLNQFFDVVNNYPMPGRSYKIILKAEF